jgi:aspartate kinase
MIVMKFGGTSVEDAASILNVASIVLREERPSLVVISACAGVTSALAEAGECAASGNIQDANRILDELEVRHSAIANELLNQDSSDCFINVLWEDAAALRKYVQSVAVLKELTPRTLDQFLSYGERWSSLLIHQLLLQLGHPVEFISATSVMVTDHEFNRAAPILDEIEIRSRNLILPLLEKNQCAITQGFLGATRDGIPTTLGRGGSDYSASIFGAALDADEIQIWTDVDGILTADPSIFPDALAIDELTFDEASELAYFGARVLHPSTILPAVRKNIPVRVLNSKRSDYKGTLICKTASNEQCVVKSIAYKEGISVITVKSSEMLMSHTFLARLFEVFARYRKSIDVIATAKVSVSITIDDTSNLKEIENELKDFAEVQIERSKAVFCVVGENMKRIRGIASRVFNALDEAGINVDVISNGASHINFTFVVDENEIVSAVHALHGEFFSASAEVSTALEIASVSPA